MTDSSAGEGGAGGRREEDDGGALAGHAGGGGGGDGSGAFEESDGARDGGGGWRRPALGGAPLAGGARLEAGRASGSVPSAPRCTAAAGRSISAFGLAVLCRFDSGADSASFFRFSVDGKRISPEDTANELGLENEDIIYVALCEAHG